MEGETKNIESEVARKNEDNSENTQNGQPNGSNFNKEEHHAATFEDAISATGLGKYNLLLTLAVVFPTISQMLETSSMSYVLPIAQCDLNINLEDIGMIMSMTYIGMVTSGFFWGYLSDSYGRKMVLVFGLILNGIFGVMGAFSTSSTILMISKVCGGLVLGGPFSAAVVHMSEFYRKEYRSSAKLLWGVMGSVANLFLPLLAWLILDYHWSFNVGGHEYHTWNIFLLICAMFPLAGGICYMFMPESPKYLMNSGNNQKAMKVFQKVYTINTGRPKSTYPHQCLARETNSTDDRPIKRSALQTMVDGIKQLKLFMHKPYTSRAILGCTAALTMSSSFNTMRIWLPQIFKAINDYQLTHNGTSTDICIMLKSWHEEADNPEQVCMQMDSSTAYIHSGIVALTRLITYIVATAAINFVGSKKLLLGTLFGTSLLSGAMYFTQTANAVLVTSALSSALGNVSSLMFVSITVEMFPTSLRTVAISLHHTCARLATLLGNMVFPYILQAGCIPTFSFVALGPLIAGMLAMFYPDMDNKPLT